MKTNRGGQVSRGAGGVGRILQGCIVLLMIAAALWNQPEFIQSAPKTKIGNVEVAPVDCSTFTKDTDARMVTFNSNKTDAFVVSLPKWSKMARTTNHEGAYAGEVHAILQDLRDDEIYIDVGANVGLSSLWTLTSGRETYAFDPIEFDIQKICEGVQANLELGHARNADKYFLYRTLVGNELKDSFGISRPDSNFGKFEQASIFSNTVGVVRKPKLVTEYVPMVTLDAIIPANKPIGLVKIDVQGAEMMVVQGMTQILSRTRGYPATIFYEEQARVTKGAGVKLRAVQTFLESYGYTCRRETSSDIRCDKPRAETQLRH